MLDNYWADGHLGQYAIVVPSLDLVVVNRVDRGLTSKRVGERRKAKLLWLIESAAGTIATDLGPEPQLVVKRKSSCCQSHGKIAFKVRVTRLPHVN
jgi:hypothetical protein